MVVSVLVAQCSHEHEEKEEEYEEDGGEKKGGGNVDNCVCSVGSIDII